MQIGLPEIIGASCTMVAAFGMLWKQFLVLQEKLQSQYSSYQKVIQAQLKECEDGHLQTRKEVFDLNGKVERLSGERDGLLTGVDLVIAGIREELRQQNDEKTRDG